MVYWYKDEKKVIELAEFLTDSGKITSTDELLEYFKYPEKYTEVWNIYEKEILGAEQTHIGSSKKMSLRDTKKTVKPMTSVEQCACGAKKVTAYMNNH